MATIKLSHALPMWRRQLDTHITHANSQYMRSARLRRMRTRSEFPGWRQMGWAWAVDGRIIPIYRA